MKRREFLQLTGATGLGLMLGCTGSENKVTTASADDVELNHFVFIDTNGIVTILNHKPELGQGVYQAIPMIIAEELEVDINKIKIVQSVADKEKYGNQGIGGSTSVRRGYTELRKIGASGKHMLMQAAANKWGCPIADCWVENGIVLRKNSKEQLAYGDLVLDAAQLEVPENVELKKSADFEILGKPTLRQDIPMKVNGAAVFGLDIEVENMLYASVERTPYFFGAVESYNKDEVEALPGVTSTVILKTELFGKPREGVAIMSDDYFTAFKARKQLTITWRAIPEAFDNDKVFERFHQEKTIKPTAQRLKNEDKQLLSSAVDFITAEYECPYEAHSPMEPMNATVWVKADGTVEAWLPTQNGQRARTDISTITGIPEENITVNVTFLGGGFGRRSLQDFAAEAALLSAETKRPVKVVWSREDDTNAGPFRPATLNVFKAGFDKKKLTSFSNHIIAQIIGHQNPGADLSRIGGGTYEGAYWGYNFANYTQAGTSVQLPIPIWYWRSVYSSTNCFVNESFVDEVAIHAGEDPMNFRIKYMDDERAVSLLEAIRKQSNWDNPAPGEYKGVAFAHVFASYCAQVVTVKKSGAGVKIVKVDAAIDCGQTINPDTIEAQIEGSIIMGLTAAYKGGITINGGKVQNNNFDKYELLRINETPEIEVQIMINEHAPGGIGEPGFPPTAPALANAIFNASGVRLRKLPFTEVGIV
ncbi:molybdopterin cofactor-binding domain-containing protein [uncultured Draconibacterium sp.]|uniref:xanthine dehydrogenase family protein molybdopterin-binding subunit n=1 Tax=uncultured Draconibacterium sp. TaxID=1573823 RepID=UPI0025FD42C7|nr:molybdopterin cofactor-binding domain-containing protein [uncultured Draconibacterium sp.]